MKVSILRISKKVDVGARFLSCFLCKLSIVVVIMCLIKLH